MTQDTKPDVREQKRQEVRASIADAVIELMAEGGAINHDLVSDAAGISRRTVYRYFPDKQALLAAASTRVRQLAGDRVAFPTSERELLDTHSIYTGFDRIASIATLVRSTPHGRAMRLSQKDERQAHYTAATADAVAQLPAEDRVLATAMLQVLHTTPWLEMRDHWDLTGEQIARATGWAIRTLLADLRSRGGAALAQRIEPSDTVKGSTSVKRSKR
jgi:AcrR family transcriptional regulator